MLDDCETSEANVKKSKMDEKNVLLNKTEKKVGYNRCRKPTSTTDNARAKTYTKFHLISLIYLIQNTPSFHH